MDDSAIKSESNSSGAEPVGRVKLTDPRSEGSKERTGSLGVKLLVGVVMVGLTIVSLIIILSGAFQLVPST
jgi:hypothetical protein